jgi:tetratricopeptide (TPR) repeat protein
MSTVVSADWEGVMRLLMLFASAILMIAWAAVEAPTAALAQSQGWQNPCPTYTVLYKDHCYPESTPWLACGRETGQRAIDACTAAILSGDFGDGSRESTYLWRAYLEVNQGQYDHAIADYDQVLFWRTSPDDSSAVYGARGYAYLAKGDFDHATADYGEAIRLGRMDLTDIYRERGIAYLYSSALQQALADLDKASELEPKSGETWLWLEIVTRRNKLPSRLAQATAKLNMTLWPAPVIRALLGEMQPEAVLFEAYGPVQECVGNFFIAELALERGAKEEAARLFTKVVTGCDVKPEVAAANAELRVLHSRR